MQIELCTHNDIQELIDVAIKSYMEYYTYLWHDNGTWYVNKCFNFNKINEEFSDLNSAFYLLRHNGMAIGFIKLNLNAACGKFTSAESLELERIYLVKEASGKGFGKSTVNFVIELAKASNKKLVWLKTMDSSQAVDFYKKLGFVIESTLELDFQEMRKEYRGMYLMYYYV